MMPFCLQLTTCVVPSCRNRFDPAKSDSKFPALFCSLQCESKWISDCLRHVSLADVFDIQKRANRTPSSSAASAGD